MNRFSSPRYTRPSVWVSDAHPDGRLWFLSQGQLLATVIHSLLIGQRKSVSVGFQGTDPDDTHLSRLERMVSILDRSGFLTRKQFETPSYRFENTGRFSVRFKVSRPPPEYLESQVKNAWQVFDIDTLISGLIRVYLWASILQLEKIRVRLSRNYEAIALRWIGQFTRSLGYWLTEVSCDGNGVLIEFSREEVPDPKWPLDDFLAANQWRVLAYYLTKLMGRDCEVCNPQSVFRPRRYELGWCPIYFDEVSFGQLVSLQGFSADQIDEKIKELGAEAIEGCQEGPLFIPASNWGEGEFRGKIVTFPSRDWPPRILSKVPPPPRRIGIRIERTSKIAEGDISLSLIPLGGGQEIGANSYLLKIGSRRLLLDCGLDVSEENSNPLGFTKLERIDHLDAIVISHAHMDHIGSLMMAHTLFPGVPIIATPETAAVMRVMIQYHSGSRFKRLHEVDLGVTLPPTSEWDESFEKVLYEVPFGREWPIPVLPGVTVQFLRAGHILGAAHLQLKIGNRRLLYTGDFCLRDQFTVRGSEILSGDGWDTVITEATYGASGRDIPGDTETAVSKLADLLSPTIEAGGTVLLPAFSLGRAQEVYAVVERTRAKYWPELPRDRIYVGGLATRFFPLYSQLSEATEFKVPADVPHIPDVDVEDPGKALAGLREGGSAILIATHGMMMEGTLSYALGLGLLERPDAAIALTGYQTPNSLGGALKDFLETGTLSYSSLPSRGITVKARVGELPLSGHATLEELKSPLLHHRPDRVVIVHGPAAGVTNLALSLKTLLPEASIYAPTNLETVPLGDATFEQDVLDEWQKMPLHLPQPPSVEFSDQPDRERGPPPRELTVRTDSDLEYVTRKKGENRRALDIVWLSPSKLNARILIESSERLPIAKFTRIEILKRGAKGQNEVISHDAASLSRIHNNRLVEVLPPGDYVLKSEVLGGTLEQDIRVLLDFREYADEWVFDANNEIRQRIPVLEGHLVHFQHLLVQDKDGHPVEDMAYNAVAEGENIELHFLKLGRSRRRYVVQFVFGSEYPTSEVPLWLDRSVPPKDAVSIDTESAISGIPLSLKITSGDFALDSIRGLSGPPVRLISSNGNSASFVFLEPGEAKISIELAKSNGYYYQVGRRLVVASPLELLEGFQEELPPDSDVEITAEIESPGNWRNWEASFDGTPCRAVPEREILRIAFKTPKDPTIGKLAVRAYSDKAGATCTLLDSPIAVGFGERIDFKASCLAIAGETGCLVLKRQGPFTQDRKQELLDNLNGWNPFIESQESEDELKIRFSVLAEMKGTFAVDFPYQTSGARSLRVLSLENFDVALIQEGNRIERNARPLETVQLRTLPEKIGAFREGTRTSMVLLRTSPFLEWQELVEEPDGSLSAFSLAPGEYLIALLHYGRIVWERTFSVMPVDGIERAEELGGARIMELVGARDFDEYLRHFISERKDTPPSIVAVGRSGDRLVLDGLDEEGIASQYVREHSSKGLSLFVTPKNEVPSALSRALFNENSKWVALSYPCPRDANPSTVEKTIAEMTAPLGKYRVRVEKRRKILEAEIESWTPVMGIRCPECSSFLKVDMAEHPPRTFCRCGFETRNVGFTLQDLSDESFSIFTLQYEIFSYLIATSRQAFGSRIGGSLRCTRCDFKTPFQDLGSLHSVEGRIRETLPDRLPGDLAYFVREGWWNITNHRLAQSEKLQGLSNGHCPRCCNGHIDVGKCPDSPLIEGAGKSVVILSDLGSLAPPAIDQSIYSEDVFTSVEFPGLSGPEGVTSKILRMVREADSWWEGG